MTADWSLVASRFVHLAAVALLFGVSLFPFYTWRRGEAPPAVAVRVSAFISVVALFFALVSGAAWFAFTVNAMAGSPDAYLDRDTMQFMLKSTDFGRLWIARGAAAVLLLILALAGLVARSRRLIALIATLAALLLLSLAGTGHAQTGSGSTKWLQAGADALHLLGAGAWLGGLVSLAIIARRGTSEEAEKALTRFSGIGYAAVATILATGLINSWFLVGTIDGLVSTAYGRLLILKILVFATMVAIAGLNRFRLVPRLARESDGDRPALSRLRTHILAEQSLGLAVLAIVAFLGTMAPPTSGA